MKLEPANQIRLFSHNEQFENLKNLYSKKKMPNKILFSGEKGIGKCTLAYNVINYIQSHDEENSYDDKNLLINSENRSFKLIQNKSNTNFILIDVSIDKKKY